MGKLSVSQPHFFKTGCSFLKSAPWRLQCANHLLTFVLFRPSPKHPIYLSPHDHIPYIIIPSRNNIFFNYLFLAIFFPLFKYFSFRFFFFPFFGYMFDCFVLTKYLCIPDEIPLNFSLHLSTPPFFVSPPFTLD